uniref:Uncharacterized protein n=1 Tax=Knipowitschia caucasica TaxID=637954 RepID=A0AAV2M7F2_KNICA
MKCWIYPGDAEKRERGSQNLVLTQQTLHWPLWEVVWRDAAAVDSTTPLEVGCVTGPWGKQQELEAVKSTGLSWDNSSALQSQPGKDLNLE